MGDVFGFIGDALLKVALPALSSLAVSVGTAVFFKVLKIKGIEFTAASEDRIRDISRDAVSAVEERARRSATKVAGETKRDIAVDIIMSKEPKLSPAEAGDALDAALPKARTDGFPVPSTPATLGVPTGRVKC